MRPSGPHVLVLGASGMGKTSGVIVPSLLSLTTSCVVNDWKGELYVLTAGYRARVLGQRVLRFAPGETRVCGPWKITAG